MQDYNILLLVQMDSEPISRSYLRYPSLPQALEALLQMFEASSKKSEYTNKDL
jgi:hypothetical protein